MRDYQRLYIGGEWITPAQRGVFETCDPSDESVLAQVAAATAQDIDLAVAAARRAFDEGDWPRWTGAQRAQVLRRIAEGIRARQDELAAIEVRDNGKPLPEALVGHRRHSRLFRVLRGARRRLGSAPRAVDQLPDERFNCFGDQGAGGRRRRDHSVEFPDADGFVEGRAGPGRRLHRGAQTVGADTADGDRTGSASPIRPACRRGC